MEAKKVDSAALQRASSLIQKGEVVAIPTETRYGLAADALNPEAVERVCAIKGRFPTQNIPVLVADRAMLEQVASHISGEAAVLMDKYWPGPLTLVLPAVKGLPKALVNSKGGVGVRVSSDPVATELVRLVGRPITATSANLSSEPAAKTASEAKLPGVALVLDDGERAKDVSTVVDCMGDLRVLRQGAIKL
ncbi:MAG: L-threonylcarbamoyladenylate synthase [Pseudomonadota bacterium]